MLKTHAQNPMALGEGICPSIAKHNTQGSLHYSLKTDDLTAMTTTMSEAIPSVALPAIKTLQGIVILPHWRSSALLGTSNDSQSSCSSPTSHSQTYILPYLYSLYILTFIGVLLWFNLVGS